MFALRPTSADVATRNEIGGSLILPGLQAGWGQSPLKSLIQRFVCAVARTVLRASFGLRVHNLPSIEGPVILAPNHASFLDPMLLQIVFPRHVTFLMDSAIFASQPLNWFYRFWNAIPLSTTGAPAAGALKEALRASHEGRVVGIFPEGRIARDGRLQDGQAGVALLMQRSRVPVIPVAILGAYDVLPRHARFFRPGRLMIVFGEPIPPTSDEVDKKSSANRLRDQVMTAIADLLERYRTWL